MQYSRRRPPHSISIGGLRTPAPVRAAPPSWGRHPQTFTAADIGRVRAYAAKELNTYSMTLSARASSVGEMTIPSAFAVLRFITNSNLVGCETGRSAGFRPFKIKSTYPAAK